MIPPADRRVRLGILLVLAGLLLQLAASFFWSPAAFLLSAGIGLPLVGVGVLALLTGMRGSVRASLAQTATSDRREP